VLNHRRGRSVCLPVFLTVFPCNVEHNSYINIHVNHHVMRYKMKTVQMTLDEKLVTTVDKVAKTLGTTRSAFARDALRMALKHYKTKTLEEKHRKGYLQKPAKPGEFSVWEDEHAWGD